MIVLGGFESDEIDRQPKIVNILSYSYMHVSNTVQVFFRNELHLDNLSTLASGSHFCQLLDRLDVKILRLVLIVYVNSLRK